jgi:hypothetical protein
LKRSGRRIKMSNYFVVIDEEAKTVERYKFESVEDDIITGIDYRGEQHKFKRNNVTFIEDLEDVCYSSEKNLVKFIIDNIMHLNYMTGHYIGILIKDNEMNGAKELIMDFIQKCNLVKRLREEAYFHMEIVFKEAKDV